MDRITNQINKTALQNSRRLIAELQERGLHVQNAFLFGSHAKGYARRGSDIDIAVISRDLSGDWLDDFCHLTRIADDIDPRIEVIPFLPQDFRDENPLVWEIKTTGIPLVRDGKNRKRRVSRKRAPNHKRPISPRS